MAWFDGFVDVEKKSSRTDVRLKPRPCRKGKGTSHAARQGAKKGTILTTNIDRVCEPTPYISVNAKIDMKCGYDFDL
jgi:hypothetical protein